MSDLVTSEDPHQIHTLALPARTSSVGFISDLHLCADMPRTALAFRQLLCEGVGRLGPKDPLFILGDLFEAWIGDDSLDQPFEAECARVLAEAGMIRPIYVMRGNRDFLLGPRFFAETNTLELADRVAVQAFGEITLLCHGDELCLADTAYQQFRTMVRQPAWQAGLLSRSWAERQALARQMRAASRAPSTAQEVQAYAYADADEPLALQWMAQCKARTLVHGHTHHPGSNRLGHDACRHVLSDWDLDGHFGPARAEVLLWSAEGWQRVPVGTATTPS